ncbi:beta-ribofuranosylaminobenzene 5'-phosphate synthase family protein [Bradyrhizobium canariense]|uniref:Beta-RFAP synthase n=1 Tax=Bradyrhizobium canariense TaxID=255045 RepID=A0A1H2ASS1_9BRAD|nr:beta-ribofuranosylaminobenzene 5'-phosphate synthase family protein [Bradyrhizobium canariense]SDT48839.1 beta-RFAP synthase [Bradyrhizobium canariense]
MRLRVHARPRIHTGLVDLAGVSDRSFCGVGFSISGPCTSWCIEDAKNIRLNGISHLDHLALNDIERVVNDLKAMTVKGFSATLERSPPQHVGLGTKTSLLLSLIAAINRLKDLSLSDAEIQQMSGRGGASGIGINLFFCGGVVWDGGHATTDNLIFVPSSTASATELPPLIARWSFPDHWTVGLVLPDNPTFFGEKEASFFKEKTPLPSDQVLLTMSAVYHGVIPAFATANLSLMKGALERVHSTGLKREELRAQTEKTIDTFRRFQSLPRIASGLSSLGPLIYCIFDRRDSESREALENLARLTGSKFLGVFSGCNSGFEVEAA